MFGPRFTGPTIIVSAEEGEEGTEAKAVDGKALMAVIWLSGSVRSVRKNVSAKVIWFFVAQSVVPYNNCQVEYI